MARSSRLGPRAVNAGNVHFVKVHRELMEAAARLDRARTEVAGYLGTSKTPEQRALLAGIDRDAAEARASVLGLAARLLK